MDHSEFKESLDTALRAHEGCSRGHLLHDFNCFVERMEECGIRLPNDWQPQYTGALEMRWHNGPRKYSESDGAISVTLFQSDGDGIVYTIRGRMPGQKRTYEREGMSIPQISRENALSLLTTLVQILDGAK